MDKQGFMHLTTIILLGITVSGCGLDSSSPTTTPAPPPLSPFTPTGTAQFTQTATPTPAHTAIKITEMPSTEPTPTAEPTQTPIPTPISPPATAESGETWIRSIDEMTTIYIPAGEFEMGSDEAELDAAYEGCERDRGQGRCDRSWFTDESPRHLVSVDSFWIDRTEVTNAQFATFLNEAGNQIEGGVTWLDLKDESSLIEQTDGEFRPKTGYAGHPAIEVTWYAALAYCQWAGGWLPSEDKWEFAARGPERTIYPWGDEAPTCELANVSGCQGSLMPVGSFPEGASSYGVQDMAGNVYEWVAEWSMPYPGTQYDNPDFGSTFKVVRGGSWSFLPYYMRSAHRDYVLMPDVSEDFVGFRCVVPLE